MERVVPFFLFLLLFLQGCGGDSADEIPGKLSSKTSKRTGPLPRLFQVVAGQGTACGMSYAGGVYCWGQGDDSNGKLGVDGSTNRDHPVEVLFESDDTPVNNIVQVVAAEKSFCALDSGGGVVCWGNEDRGQLGNGQTAAVKKGVFVLRSSADSGEYLNDIVQLASHPEANFYCGLTSEMGVKCWGDNEKGQLGNGGTTGANALSSYPVEVIASKGSAEPLEDVVQVAVGGEHACALIKDGSILCWGNEELGRLGHGAFLSQGDGDGGFSHPVSVVTGEGKENAFTGGYQLALGGEHSCALATKEEKAYCWGHGHMGQLGDGEEGTGHGRSYPAAVEISAGTPLTDLAQLSLGDTHSCGLQGTGDIQCWGSGTNGELGHNQTQDSTRPVGVNDTDGSDALLEQMIQVSAGAGFTCGLSEEGEIPCWGLGDKGQLGNDALSSTDHPVWVVEGDGVTSRLDIGPGSVAYECPAGGSTCGFVASTLPVLSLLNPLGLPSNVEEPKVRVHRVDEENQVVLHLTDDCSDDSIGGEISSGYSVDIVVSEALEVGEHTLYALVDDTCGEKGLDYELDDTIVALSMSSGPVGNDTTPDVTATNIVSGDSVSIFDNATCTGTALASGNAPGDSHTLTLSTLSNDGEKTFYPQVEGVCYGGSSTTYTLDTVAPSVTLDSNLQNLTVGEDFVVTFDDSVIGDAREGEGYNLSVTDATPCSSDESNLTVTPDSGDLDNPPSFTVTSNSSLDSACIGTPLNISGSLSDSAGNSTTWSMTIQLSSP